MSGVNGCCQSVSKFFRNKDVQATTPAVVGLILSHLALLYIAGSLKGRVSNLTWVSATLLPVYLGLLTSVVIKIRQPD